MNELEFYQYVHELEAQVKEIHAELLDLLKERLPLNKPLEYQASLLISLMRSFDKSIESVLGQLGATNFYVIDPTLIKKADEVLALERAFQVKKNDPIL